MDQDGLYPRVGIFTGKQWKWRACGSLHLRATAWSMMPSQVSCRPTTATDYPSAADGCRACTWNYRCVVPVPRVCVEVWVHRTGVVDLLGTGATDEPVSSRL